MSSDFGKSSSARLPANHIAVLEAIRGVEAGRHVSAQEVYGLARAIRPRLGFATVHRALARLCEIGYVSKLDIPGAVSAVYERAAESHAHFRCLACGTIRDVEFTVPCELLTALADRHRWEIAAESTTFSGRCENCAATAPAR